MPEGAVAEPPVQVPAAPVPKAAPENIPQINVNADTIDRGPKAPPPKAGSAKAELFKSLRKKVGAPVEEPAKESPPAPPERKPSSAKAKESPAPTPEAPEPEIEESVPVEAESPKVEGEKPAKEKTGTNPWRLVDQYKAKNSQLEKELAELKSTKVSGEERESIMAEMKKIQARNKELEDEIRYVNYEKSSEFQTQYDEPYKKAWEVAMGELREIPIQNENGELRETSDADIWELVNMSLYNARKTADRYYGEFADDVMRHRNEIQKLLRARSMALKDAKEKGGEREKQVASQREMETKATATVIKDTWEKFNKQAHSHEKWGKYFVPTEGDQEGNSRLAKGYQLVDRAFSEDVRNPEFNSDQRAQAVQRLVAVRNRAAAFSRLVYMNEQLQAKLDAASKELEDFKNSSPETTLSNNPGGPRPGLRGTAKDAVFSALRKYATPG